MAWGARTTPGCKPAPLWVFCRSDYHLATPALAAQARAATIYKAEKFSDHAPLTVDYDFTL
jgi:endonuclease/exonuclease/phosphatase family metal-dependent hydrolase